MGNGLDRDRNSRLSAHPPFSTGRDLGESMNYYQHHIGDFIKATSCLNDSQVMLYLRLIWMYYDSESPLPNNPRVLSLKTGASVEDVTLILEAYFTLDGDEWKHTRCDEEIDEYHAICNRNKANGLRGGRPKKTQSVSSGLPDDTDTEPCRNPNQKPVTNISTTDVVESAKRATRLQEDWMPSKEDFKFCVDNRPDLNAGETIARFKDYWIAQPGQKGRKLDWSATWRNWVRNERAPVAKTKAAESDEFFGQIFKNGKDRHHANIIDITPGKTAAGDRAALPETLPDLREPVQEQVAGDDFV